MRKLFRNFCNWLRYRYWGEVRDPWRIDTIICPECGCVQEAPVEYLPGMPWPSYVHECEQCDAIITESDWQRVGE